MSENPSENVEPAEDAPSAAFEPSSDAYAPDEADPLSAVSSDLSRLQRSLRRWKITAGALALLAAFLVVALAGQLTVARTPLAGVATPGPTASATDAPQTEIPDLARRDPADTMAVGAVDAPVVMIEWFDYRCPFCAAHANRTVPALLEEYVDEGLVRIEYHDVVFFGDDSAAAAIAGRAAAAQGRFAAFLEVLFAAAPPSGHPDMPREKLIDFARQAGVADIDAFTAALDDPQIAAAVAESTQYAQSLGVTSVPFFLIGQTVLAGAQPLETFRDAIDQELARP